MCQLSFSPVMRFGALLVMISLIASCTGERPDTPIAGPSPSPIPARSPSPSPSPAPLEEVSIGLERIAKLQAPVGLATRPSDPTLYVIEKGGALVALRDDGEPMTLLELNVADRYEQGLIGIAFSPEGSFLYLNYTDPEGHTRVDEFPMEGDEPDPTGRREILFVEQPLPTHNGGSLAFGPDGYLYIALGDGGWLLEADALGADHPTRWNSQSLDTLLGKILRIDPRPNDDQPYRVPPDNPFVDREGARPEIWALGLRNPWRMSFDRETGDLWIADVGESDREEVNFQPASSRGGENYGWPHVEGSLSRLGGTVEGLVPPLHEYGRHGEQKAIIGGYVYRGTRIPGLYGTYLFGDAFQGRLRGLRQEDGTTRERIRFDTEVRALSSFGEGEEGKLFALSVAGPVYQIIGDPP